MALETMGYRNERKIGLLPYLVISGGLILRIWNLPNLGLTHWDEGIYALSAAKIVQANSLMELLSNFPVYYAPPLLIATIALLFLLFGTIDWVAILPSITFGVLTLVVVYKLGELVYDSRVGLLAAFFLSITNFHLIYSRMALTDVPVTFWFTVAVYFYLRAQKQKKLLFYALSGGAVGAAMLTKYSGPIIYAIIALSFAFETIRDISRLPVGDSYAKLPLKTWLQQLLNSKRRQIKGFILLSFVAFTLYFPYFLGVEVFLGYEKLLLHHASYSFLKGTLIKTPPTVILKLFWYWSSPLLLVGLIVGISFMILRRESTSALFFIYLLVYTAMLTLYMSYTRLALPLLPVISLLSAYGIISLYRATKSNAAKTAILVFSVALTLSLLIPSVQTLKINTTGYRKAAVTVAQLNRSGAPVYCYTLQSYSFYDPTARYLTDEVLKGDKLAEEGIKYFVFDYWATIMRTPLIESFFRENHYNLTEVARIPNGLYAISIDPFSSYLEYKKRPEAFRYIHIYRTEQPLRISKAQRETKPVGESCGP